MTQALMKVGARDLNMGDAEIHLSNICKRFARVLPAHAPFPTKFEKSKDPYRALVRSVVYQQLSGKAAATILGRVVALFPDKDFKKAVIEAWLAWQEEPGMTFGTAFQKNQLLKDKPLALRFVAWVQTLISNAIVP